MTQKETAQKKREARMAAELERVQQMRDFELEAVRRAGGHGYICGIDEAGRGPLAGPVAAAAVILPEDLLLPYLNDSKKVTEKRRGVLFEEIKEKALAWSVVMVPPERIDEINILQATYEAMRTAVGQLAIRPDVLVNDAVTIPGLDILQVPVIKGDAKCISVAAASILAKVTRDTYMKEMDSKYPVYGFAGHKGYGTKSHCEAIAEYGPCPIHRSRFLQSKGVVILEKNFRDRDGEIDLIGEEDGVLLFIEVKYRSSSRFGDPGEAVTPAKQRSICRTALYYLYRTGRGTQGPVRFDVVCVTDEGIRWIRGAFPFQS